MKFMRFVVIILALFVVSGCGSDLGPKKIYYGEVESVEKDNVSALVYFTQYIDKDGISVNINEEVIIEKDAAKKLPKTLAVGDKVKMVTAEENGEQVLISVELVSPGNKNKSP